MSFVLFQDKNLEDRAKNLLNELGIKSIATLDGKKGRVYIFEEKYLDNLKNANIKYKLLPKDKIEKYLTTKGLMYLKNIS